MKNKIVIITGGSDGLGKSVAKKIVVKDATVILISQNESKLKEAIDEIGGNISYFVCDISDRSQILSTIEKIKSHFGRIDILINNAGVWTEEELEKTKPEQRKKVLDVNAYGNIEFTKNVEPIMRKQKEGHILNVISTSGSQDTSSGDNSLWQTYGASKWALAGFTRALKDSLDGTGVKVTGFYPGGFESNLYENAGNPADIIHNQPWMMATEDVADSLLFCLTRPDDMLVEKMVVTKFIKNP